MRLVVVFGLLLLAACSSAMGLDAYADGAESLGRSYETETTGLHRDLDEELQAEIDGLERSVDSADPVAVAGFAAEALEITAARTATFFAMVGDALARHRDDLVELRPPSEVETEHHEYLDAMDAVLSGLPSLLDGLTTARAFDEIDAAVYGSGFADAQPRLIAACIGLEQRLTELGATANLRCPA